ncbi:hypothetical protein Tco_0439811 [Tanacetum coccineum]
MAGSDDENPPPPPPQQTPTQQAPHTVSTIKLPILKKGEYDIWAMKMEHYLSHTDYPIWEVIQKGNGPVSVSTDTNGVIKVLPPKTAEEILARERERKARTTLLMALPEDHLAKFHKMTDAKEMWDAIKSRFGGNDESKKMQKYILKQQFEGFSVSNSEGLHKGYDRFQSLLSQLEIHGAGVSTEDANQKFLRSLPSSWSQVSLVMRTKPGVDSLSFDDLYNNLRVFESDVKGSTGSSSSAQNVAFVSSESTSSTNDVSTAYGVSTSSGYNSQRENSSSYTDELMYSFFANQSSGPHLDHEDLEQLDEFDLEEMDLKWQVAMISMRLKKFYKKTGRRLQFDAKEPVGFDKTKCKKITFGRIKKEGILRSGIYMKNCMFIPDTGRCTTEIHILAERKFVWIYPDSYPPLISKKDLFQIGIKHLCRKDSHTLKSDTSEIKSMMIEIYQAFKEPPSHTEGEHVTMEDETEKVESDKAKEEPTRAVPISTIKPITRPNPEVALIESSSRPPLTDTILKIPVPQQTALVIQREGKGIATHEQLESTKKLMPISKVFREDPDKPIRVPYMINEKMHYLTNDRINAHLEKEDTIKKAVEEAKITKAGEKFKKAQDDKHQVLKRDHSQKVKRLMELNKKRSEQYMWTISNRLKPEPITDKKKNTIINDLMISLGKRYKRLKKIPKELGIQSALPAPILEQAPSQSLGRKGKHMKLEPKIKVPRLECNRSLLEGVPFMNNMLEESGYTKETIRIEYEQEPPKCVKDGAITSGDGATASTSKTSNADFRDNEAISSSNKGHVSSDDINMVTIRNPFTTLNEEDKVFENVDTSNAGNDGNISKDVTKVGDDTYIDVEDVYDETAQFMASSAKRASGSGGANEAIF